MGQESAAIPLGSAEPGPLVESDTNPPCRCHRLRAAASPTHGGHCCFLPATQACHREEVAAWMAWRLTGCHDNGEVS